MLKKCSICNISLSYCDFGIKTNGKTYKTCIKCRELRNEYYHIKCNEKDFQHKRYLKTINNLNNNDVAARKYLVYRAKLRSKKNNIIFNITYKDIIIPKICPILQIPLFFGENKNNTPSIDRVINNKGYISENVKVISNLANTIKRDLSIEIIERILLYMKE